MKIRDRLIKCGDFGIEREHLTIDTLYAIKCYLILRKAGMNILGGKILFYFLAGGTDAETMRKLKELEKKNKDRLCLVSQYETYPAGLGVFMHGDLMYDIMATGLNIKDAQEMTPLEAVKLLENHLHFTMETENTSDIETLLKAPAKKKKEKPKKKEPPSESKENPAQIPAPNPETENVPKAQEKAEAEKEEQAEKATVPERFRRRHKTRAREDEEKRDPVPYEESPDPEESDYFKDPSDRLKYLEYEKQADEKALLEKIQEEEYMEALSEDKEFLRENGILEEEDPGDPDLDDRFILDVGDE